MLTRILITLLAPVIFPYIIAAQNPVLSSLSPARVYTQSEPTVGKLTIEGKNMWPENLSITMAGQVMHVHFKKAGRDEVIRRVGIAPGRQIVDFISTGWLNTPGDIEVYVTIDAFSSYPPYRSNSLYLRVEPTPATAPVLNSISNSSFTVGAPKEKYYIRLYGKNFGETRSTYATIGGYAAPAGWQHLEDGVIDVWVPSQVYTNAGSYPVIVHTKYGTSNPVTLTINPAVLTLSTPIKKNTMQVKTLPNNNMAELKTDIRGILHPEKVIRLNTEMVKGIRVNITGAVSDGATKASLENYIASLENVFVIDNQLNITETNGNINITVKGAGVENDVIERVKKQIKDKSAAMNLQASVL